MIREIVVSSNRTLILSNILKYVLPVNCQQNPNQPIVQLQNYMETNGIVARGPIIECSKIEISDGVPVVEISILQQTDEFIENTQLPYTTIQ